MKTSITITAGGGRSCDVAVETGTPLHGLHRGPDGDGHPLHGLHHCACVCVSYEREGRGRRTVRAQQLCRGRRTVRAQQLWYAIIEAQTETGTPYMVYIAVCVCLCQLRARGPRPADGEGPAAVVRHHQGPDGDGHPLHGLHHRVRVSVSVTSARVVAGGQ